MNEAEAAAAVEADGVGLGLGGFAGALPLALPVGLSSRMNWLFVAMVGFGGIGGR